MDISKSEYKVLIFQPHQNWKFEVLWLYQPLNKQLNRRVREALNFFGGALEADLTLIQHGDSLG